MKSAAPRDVGRPDVARRPERRLKGGWSGTHPKSLAVSGSVDLAARAILVSSLTSATALVQSRTSIRTSVSDRPSTSTSVWARTRQPPVANTKGSGTEFGERHRGPPGEPVRRWQHGDPSVLSDHDGVAYLRRIEHHAEVDRSGVEPCLDFSVVGFQRNELDLGMKRAEAAQERRQDRR